MISLDLAVNAVVAGLLLGGFYAPVTVPENQRGGRGSEPGHQSGELLRHSGHSRHLFQRFSIWEPADDVYGTNRLEVSANSFTSSGARSATAIYDPYSVTAQLSKNTFNGSTTIVNPANCAVYK